MLITSNFALEKENMTSMEENCERNQIGLCVQIVCV